MKELEPLEANHTKLKANFAGCEISLWLRNDFAAILFVRLLNSPECFQIFATDIFRFFDLDI